MGRHVPGFVDGYFGPAELKHEVEAETSPRSPNHLLADARGLAASLPRQPYDSQRKAYLARQLTGILTVLRKLAGEMIPFAEEIRGCFDVLPARADESVFEAALRELDGLLPGDGSVRERMIAWRSQFDLPTQRILPLVALIQAVVRQRTATLIPLPAGESATVELVTDRPWSGYNWYLGNYRSRVELNTDLPVRAYALPQLVAHEIYPGHHTEHAVKEALLYRGGGRLEHSILLINTPECLISEGIASLALDCVLPEDSRAAWLSEVFFPAAGMETLSVEQVLAIGRASRALAAVSGNAAFLLNEDGRDRAEVAAYLERYALLTPAEAQKRLSFLTDPLWRPYVFTYYYGEQLLRGWLDRIGWQTGFRRLVSEPLYPSQLIGAP